MRTDEDEFYCIHPIRSPGECLSQAIYSLAASGSHIFAFQRSTLDFAKKRLSLAPGARVLIGIFPSRTSFRSDDSEMPRKLAASFKLRKATDIVPLPA